MVNELAFRTRTVLNTLVLALALARARHVGRRLAVRVLTWLAIPLLAITFVLYHVVRLALEVLV